MTNDAVKLAPSILAADFAHLGDQVREAERAGADRIHADVMDGHFVPNLSMGPMIVRSLRTVTRLPLEAHLMISNPDAFVDEFARAGVDSFLVHWEGANDLSRTVRSIKALGKLVGVAINPATSAAVLEEILQDLDQVLVMTVNPGFGHQRFLHGTLAKITRARRMIDQSNRGAVSRSTEGSTRKPPRWPSPREPTCSWLDPRFSMTTKASSPPWSGCGPRYGRAGGHRAARDKPVEKKDAGAPPIRSTAL